MRRGHWEIELCSSVAPPLHDWQGRPPMTDSASYWLMQKSTNQIPFHRRCHLLFPPGFTESTNRSGAFFGFICGVFSLNGTVCENPIRPYQSIRALCVCVFYTSLRRCSVSSKTVLTEKQACLLYLCNDWVCCVTAVCVELEPLQNSSCSHQSKPKEILLIKKRKPVFYRNLFLPWHKKKKS